MKNKTCPLYKAYPETWDKDGWCSFTSKDCSWEKAETEEWKNCEVYKKCLKQKKKIKNLIVKI